MGDEEIQESLVASTKLITGAMVAGSVFLMLSKNLVRFIFGLVLASNAVNLVIFAAGRLETSRPPLIPQDTAHTAVAVANSLPQALILTAIVIGFALLAFILILFFRTPYQKDYQIRVNWIIRW